MTSRLRNLSEDPPQGWDAGHLGDICRMRTEQVSPSEVDETVYVGLEHMTPGRRYVDTWGSSTEVDSAKFRFHQGDVLFGKLRPYLRKVSMVDRDGVCSTDIIALRPKSSDDGDFLLYLCQSERVLQFAISTSGGTRMPRTSWSDLGECPVLLPPPEERRKIAAILRSVDEAIERTEAVIAALREVKRGMMQELLTKGIGHTEFRETEIGSIPAAWRVCRLGELCHAKGGKRLPKGTPFAAGRTSHPYIRVVDLQDKSVCSDGLQYIDEQTYRRISRYTINKDDVYISIAGTIGLVGTIPPELDGANLTENAARLVIRDKSVLDNRFLSEVLETPASRGQIDGLRGQVGVPKLALFRIEQIRIPVPPLPEQEAIVERLDAVTSAVAKEQDTVTALQTLKRGLMQQLLTGKVRVKV